MNLGAHFVAKAERGGARVSFATASRFRVWERVEGLTSSRYGEPGSCLDGLLSSLTFRWPACFFCLERSTSGDYYFLSRKSGRVSFRSDRSS